MDEVARLRRRSALVDLQRARLGEEAQAAQEVDAPARLLDAYDHPGALPDDNPGGGSFDGLEVAVRALVQTYREHPGFDPAWTR